MSPPQPSNLGHVDTPKKLSFPKKPTKKDFLQKSKSTFPLQEIKNFPEEFRPVSSGIGSKFLRKQV
jgi:hypothetical protein